MARELRIALRCDASPAIGGGHVMRCLTLADELARRGHRARFVVAAETLATVPRLGASAHRIDVLGESSATEPSYSEADVVLFDHYGLDARDHAPPRRAGAHVAVIDDLADRPHDCDLLVDTTFGRDARDYVALVPAGCRVLTGADYALLRPVFRELRDASLERRARADAPRRVFVSLGLTDVGGITARAVTALARSAALRHAEVEVLVGARSQSLGPLRELAASDARIRVDVDVADVASRMARADVALGAGGTTTWERCCLGLPTVLVVLADNQAGVARNLAAGGAAIVADEPSSVAAVASLLGDRDRLLEMSRRAAAICDGRGALRVADALERIA